MTIKKAEGGWLVDIQPGGRGHKRIRKTLTTKSEALQFEAWAKTQVVQNDGWVKPKKNLTKLSELIELWQLRIPRKLDTCSAANWTVVPAQTGHLFHANLDT